MHVTPNKAVENRYGVLQWIIEQGDAKRTSELVWALGQVVAELQRLHPGRELQPLLEIVARAR